MTRQEERAALRAAHPEWAKRCDDADDKLYRELFAGIQALAARSQEGKA